MDMYIRYDLEGLVANLTQTRPGDIDMFDGTECSNSSSIGEKHWNDFGNSTENPDPWTAQNGAYYVGDENGDAYGSFDINNGYYWGENQGRLMVVHNSTGSNIGCGILKAGKAYFRRSYNSTSNTVDVTCVS